MNTVQYIASFNEELAVPQDVHDFDGPHSYIHCHKSPSEIYPTLVNLSLQELRDLHNKLSVCIDCLEQKTYTQGIEKLHTERRYILADDKFLLARVDEASKRCFRKYLKGKFNKPIGD